MIESDLTIFFDFRCPFVYNASMWLEKVRRLTGQEPNIDWQPFSLAQVNSGKGPEFKLWEQPAVKDGSDKSLLAHCAGLAAKRQGLPAFNAFRLALLKLRHEQKKDLTDPAVIDEAAQQAGLDLGRLAEDLKDPKLLQMVGESHTRAVEEFGAFGVPTLAFPGGNSAFLKMFIPPDNKAAETYDTVFKLVSQVQHVGELKRPQPPWPTALL